MTLGTRFARLAAIAATGLIAGQHAGLAQTPAPASGPDKTAIWTLQDENASISTASLTDRYYVNGLRLGYTSGEGEEPDFLSGAASALWDGGAVRFSFDLSQQIYTPNDTAAYTPPPGDRPYAGVLLGTFGLTRDVPDSRSFVGLSLGVIGPGALAQTVQNGFHHIIGQNATNGWGDQIHNEPLLELTSARTWRLSTGEVFGMETDALPNLAVGLGNERVYAQTGVLFRIGQGLDSDYGPARIAPGPSGWDAFKPTRPFGWYVFAGGDGQGVAHDITLNGNTFRSSASVAPRALVGEMEVGLGLIAFGTRLTYTQVFQTQEFQHQKGGLHQFGSLALSVRF